MNKTNAYAYERNNVNIYRQDVSQQWVKQLKRQAEGKERIKPLVSNNYRKAEKASWLSPDSRRQLFSFLNFVILQVNSGMPSLIRQSG